MAIKKCKECYYHTFKLFGEEMEEIRCGEKDCDTNKKVVTKPTGDPRRDLELALRKVSDDLGYTTNAAQRDL